MTFSTIFGTNSNTVYSHDHQKVVISLMLLHMRKYITKYISSVIWLWTKSWILYIYNIMEILLTQRQGQQAVLLWDTYPQGKHIYQRTPTHSQRTHKIRNFRNDFIVCSMNKWGKHWREKDYVYLEQRIF